MIARFLKITSLLIFLFPAVSLADATQDVINQQDWITRQQQNMLEDKKRSLEFDTIKKDHERKKKEEEQGLSQPAVSGKMNGCTPIKEVNFSGSHSISQKNQQKIIAPFIGKCVEAEVLVAVIKTVSDYYHAQGLITTQVKVPKQNLQNGIFELQIIEGKIEKISLGKDRYYQHLFQTKLFERFENFERQTRRAK